MYSSVHYVHSALNEGDALERALLFRRKMLHRNSSTKKGSLHEMLLSSVALVPVRGYELLLLEQTVTTVPRLCYPEMHHVLKSCEPLQDVKGSETLFMLVVHRLPAMQSEPQD